MDANRFSQISLLILLIIGLISCQKEEDPISSEKNTFIKKGNLLINDNPLEATSTRIILKDELVPIIRETFPSIKSTNEDITADPSKNYTFKLQAEVSSPVYNGSVLQATHVIIKDNWTFITYNTQGPDWLGGLEIFDVSDIRNPSIVESAIMPVGDVSAIDYYDGKLYFVGATGDFEEREFNSTAFLEVVTLNKNMSIQSIDTMIDIPSYAATDIKVTDKHILVSSGSDGGITVFDKETFELVFTDDYFDARALDINSNNIFLLQGQEGRINKLDPFSFENLATYHVGYANIPESKSEIAVNDNYVLAALNEGGLKVITTDGVLKQHIPKPPTPIGGLDANNVTNSVTLSKDLVLIGNGESGVHIGGMIPELNDSIWMMGSMQFNDGASTNFVESSDSVVFIATGLEGLKIISISVDEGVPGGVKPTKPCETLMKNISSCLPERVNQMALHPELFSDTAILSVYIEEETDLYLTFLDEGAGWKNTLGYYVDNPLVSIDDIEKHVIFPNSSKINSGGGLQYGDQVKIGDKKFQAGMVVEFYFVAQGWQNGLLVDGLYTHYTNKEFNIRQQQQSILFISEGCNELILAFEDIKLDDVKCDKDFNDVLFMIKDNPDPDVPNTRLKIKGIPVK